jgi:branched-chain amino acid transport system ATP-binding protein
MSPAFFECRDLGRNFGALVALEGVTLAVERGEVLAVIGPNGAGKTTFFNLLTGVLKPSAGRVLRDGVDLTGWPVERLVQRGISRTFQRTQLFPESSALDNVRLAAQARQRGRWRILGGTALFAQTRRQAEEALTRVGLTGLAATPGGLLSHGDQRLLEVAMALVQQPDILLLDEPTQGLSIEETARAVQILKELVADIGLTVLLVEHDMEVVFSLAHRIAVLHRGRLIANGPPDAVKADPMVQDAYLGDVE